MKSEKMNEIEMIDETGHTFAQIAPMYRKYGWVNWNDLTDAEKQFVENHPTINTDLVGRVAENDKLMQRTEFDRRFQSGN